MGAQRRGASGFTLLELLVALAAGLIAIGSIYFVGAASSRHFHEQQRIAQTQMSLRMATEQMRRDIQRAGFLGTPNSSSEQTCVSPATRLQAVELFDDRDTGALPNAAENGATADRLRLVGNYATSDAYLAIGLANAAGTSITLQRDWQAFRRDFGVFGSPTYDPTAFAEVFSTDRVLHIVTLQGMHFFVRITNVNAATATITFSPGLGVGGHCVVGLADGATVAPLSRVEYLVTDLSATAGGARLQPTSGRPASPSADFLGQSGSQLIRRELQFDGATATPIAGTERIVLEFAANVDYAIVADQQITPGAPPNLTTLTGAAAENLATNTPQRIRSILVSLSARTQEQDPRFAWLSSAAGDVANGVAPTRYRVNPTFGGAARVRTMRTEVFLPNLAHRNIRP